MNGWGFGADATAGTRMAGSLTVATLGIWGLGSALLVALGSVVHLLVGLWRRRGDGPGPARVSPAA